MILSYRAVRYTSLDTLKSKIHPLLPILYGGQEILEKGNKNVTHRQTDTQTDKMKIRDNLVFNQAPPWDRRGRCLILNILS